MSRPLATPANRFSAIAGALCTLTTATAPAFAGEPVSFNTELVANVPLSAATDVSATGDVVIVGRSASGVTLLDITNPSSPAHLSTWTHPTANIFVRDARPSGNVLWCSNEKDNDFGCFALDITNPASPSLIVELAPPTFPPRVHNLWPDGTDVYLSGTALSPAGNFIIDASNLAAPTVRHNFVRDTHDNCVVGDSLYYAAGFEALYLIDVTDPDNPVDVSSYSSANSDTVYYAHQAYPFPGTDYVLLHRGDPAPDRIGLRGRQHAPHRLQRPDEPPCRCGVTSRSR